MTAPICSRHRALTCRAILLGLLLTTVHSCAWMFCLRADGIGGSGSSGTRTMSRRFVSQKSSPSSPASPPASPVAADTSEPPTPSPATTATTTSTTPHLKREYKTEASNLFGNIRIPAALFAGASAGAAFAMPLMASTVDLSSSSSPSPSSSSSLIKMGLSKRLYALLMMSALTSEIIAVVVSTLLVSTVHTTRTPFPVTNSVEELLERPEYYALEWVATRIHFLAGVFMFVLGIGIRAWITIACPIIAKAALGIVLSGSILCLAFVEELEHSSSSSSSTSTSSSSSSSSSSLLDGIMNLPFRYVQLLIQRSKQRPLFGVAAITSLLTTMYIVGNIPHVLSWIQAGNQ